MLPMENETTLRHSTSKLTRDREKTEKLETTMNK